MNELNITGQLINKGKLHVKDIEVDTSGGDFVFTLKKGTGKYRVDITPIEEEKQE